MYIKRIWQPVVLSSMLSVPQRSVITNSFPRFNFFFLKRSMMVACSLGIGACEVSPTVHRLLQRVFEPWRQFVLVHYEPYEQVLHAQYRSGRASPTHGSCWQTIISIVDVFGVKYMHMYICTVCTVCMLCSKPYVYVWTVCRVYLLIFVILYVL